MKAATSMKAGKLALVAAIVLLAALSGLSVSVFAQASLAGQEGKVGMEKAAPAVANPESAGGQPSMAGVVQAALGGSKPPMALSESEAAAFVRAAGDALAQAGVSVPQEGYAVAASHHEETGNVIVSWIPHSWNGQIQPDEADGKGYFVTFSKATGEIIAIRSIDGEKIEKAGRDDSYRIRFENLLK